MSELTVKQPEDPQSIAVDCSGVLALWHHGEHYCEIPPAIAKCPECGSDLMAEAESWDDTGAPYKDGLSISCLAEQDAICAWEDDDEDKRSWNEVMHRNWQSDWQPIVDCVANWCGAVE